MYRFEQFQAVKMSIDEAWEFFSSPQNLSKITPPSLGFNIQTELPEEMYEGLFIKYKVKPLLNISTTWVTEITRVRKNIYFVDEQRKGPYKVWHHEHFFMETKEGVLMYDVVHYDIPFGILGKMIHPIIIKPKLNQIFQHRKEVLKEKFGEFEVDNIPSLKDFQKLILQQ